MTVVHHQIRRQLNSGSYPGIFTYVNLQTSYTYTLTRENFKILPRSYTLGLRSCIFPHKYLKHWEHLARWDFNRRVDRWVFSSTCRFLGTELLYSHWAAQTSSSLVPACLFAWTPNCVITAHRASFVTLKFLKCPWTLSRLRNASHTADARAVPLLFAWSLYFTNHRNGNRFQSPSPQMPLHW